MRLHNGKTRNLIIRWLNVMKFQIWRQTVAGWNLKAIQVFMSFLCPNSFIRPSYRFKLCCFSPIK